MTTTAEHSGVTMLTAFSQERLRAMNKRPKRSGPRRHRIRSDISILPFLDTVQTNTQSSTGAMQRLHRVLRVVGPRPSEVRQETSMRTLQETRSRPRLYQRCQIEEGLHSRFGNCRFDRLLGARGSFAPDIRRTLPRTPRLRMRNRSSRMLRGY